MQVSKPTTIAETRQPVSEHDTLMSLGFPATQPDRATQPGAQGTEQGTAQGTAQRTVRLRDRVRSRLREFSEEERGAVTAEYALVIMAAVAFAGLLITILRSDEVRAMLVNLVQTALGSAG